MVTWRVTDSSIKMSGKGATVEEALANLKQKIREQRTISNASYRRIRSQI